MASSAQLWLSSSAGLLFVLKAKYRGKPRSYEGLVSRISLKEGFDQAIKALLNEQVFSKGVLQWQIK